MQVSIDNTEILWYNRLKRGTGVRACHSEDMKAV
jgi:hypothetical protein